MISVPLETGTDTLQSRYKICNFTIKCLHTKGKVLPYSLPSVKSGADPDIQAVSQQVTF